MKNDILAGELMEEEVQFCKHPCCIYITATATGVGSITTARQEHHRISHINEFVVGKKYENGVKYDMKEISFS